MPAPEVAVEVAPVPPVRLPTDFGPAVVGPMTAEVVRAELPAAVAATLPAVGARAAEVAADPGLPPTAQEAAPGRLWRSYDNNGLELAAKDPIVARQQYAELVHSYHEVLQRNRVVTNATASNVWNAWAVCDFHATQTSVTTNDARVWNAWNTVGTSATTCGCTTIVDMATTWGAWNNGIRQTVYRGRPTIEATDEQKAKWEAERVAREQQEARYRAEAAEREKKLKAEQAEADVRAKKLLVECLTSQQRDTLEQHGYFDVKLPSGATYRIHKGWSHNVKRVKPDGTVERGTFCAHPRDVVPHYDNMLAQKFMLETDEQAFLRVANRG